MTSSPSNHHEELRQALKAQLDKARVPAGAELAGLLVDGNCDGQAHMASFSSVPLESLASSLFKYGYRSESHQLDTRIYLKDLPGGLEALHLPEEAEQARRFIAENPNANIGDAARSIFQDPETGLSSVLSALINRHKAVSAGLLGHPAQNRFAAGGDAALERLFDAADYLAAAHRMGKITEDDLADAAYRLGHAVGAGMEALRQATDAFSHSAYADFVSDVNQRPESLLEVSIILYGGIFAAAGVYCAIAHAIMDMELFCVIEGLLPAVPALIVGVSTALLLCLLIDYLETPRIAEKHVLIAEEAARRTRQLEDVPLQQAIPLTQPRLSKNRMQIEEIQCRSVSV